MLACIAALGLVPALLTKAGIDHLAHSRDGFAHLALIESSGAVATVAAGLVGILRSYLTTSISQGIMFDPRQQLLSLPSRQALKSTPSKVTLTDTARRGALRVRLRLVSA